MSQINVDDVLPFSGTEVNVNGANVKGGPIRSVKIGDNLQTVASADSMLIGSNIFNGTVTGSGFLPQVVADMAIAIEVSSDQVNKIEWLAASDGLLIGTAGGEFVLCGPLRHPLLIIQENIKKGVLNSLQNHSVSSDLSFPTFFPNILLDIFTQCISVLDLPRLPRAFVLLKYLDLSFLGFLFFCFHSSDLGCLNISDIISSPDIIFANPNQALLSSILL